jgi:hypothetical protein
MSRGRTEQPGSTRPRSRLRKVELPWKREGNVRVNRFSGRDRGRPTEQRSRALRGGPGARYVAPGFCSRWPGGQSVRCRDIEFKF